MSDFPQTRTGVNGSHLEFGGGGACHGINHLSTFIQDKSRHRSNRLISRNLLLQPTPKDLSYHPEMLHRRWVTYLLFLDVDLGEFDVWVLVFHLGEMRGDEFAWTAPCCPIIYDDRLRPGRLRNVVSWIGRGMVAYARFVGCRMGIQRHVRAT